MVGQIELLDKIDAQIEEGVFPRFAIFISPEGSGKRTLMREIANKHWKYVYEVPDLKADTIRKMVSDAYKMTVPTAIIVPNFNSMSANAKGTLLKVTEEPPNNVSFLMSAPTTDSISETIRSRAVTYYLRPYSRDELIAYIDSLGSDWNDEDRDLILQVCNNISEIKKLLKIKIRAIYEYAQKLINNIGRVSTANALKSANMIAFKDEADKYDLLFVWKCVCIELKDLAMQTNTPQEKSKYVKLLTETMSKMSDLNMASLSKSNIYDSWVLSCRKIINDSK